MNAPVISTDKFKQIEDNDDYFNRFSSGLGFHSDEHETFPKYWLLPGFIAAGELTVAFGQPEQGKSQLGIDFACRLAAGLDWDNSPADPLNVLYVAVERPQQVRRRADAFCKIRGIDRLDRLLIYSRPIDLTNEIELAGLCRYAERELRRRTGDRQGLSLVIVDTFAQSISGTDANPDTMARACAGLRFCQHYGGLDGDEGPGVLVLHHSPTNGELRPRGAGNLLGAADATIHVSRKKDVVTAKVIKANDIPPDEKAQVSFRMKSVLLAVDDKGISTTASVIERIDTSSGGAQATTPESAEASIAESEIMEVGLPLAKQRALEQFKQIVADNDNKPVTKEQWRAAAYAAAGDISASGKRVKFKRQCTDLTGLVKEVDGLFSLVV